MLENFRDYFNAIDLPGPLTERAEQICAAFNQLIEQPVHDVFVTDAFEAEGARRYMSLWLCTPWHLIESKNFAVAQNMDFARLADLHYSEITRSDLANLDRPELSTTMRVDIGFRYGPRATLLAARNNCRFLQNFTAKHLMPRGLSSPNG